MMFRHRLVHKFYQCWRFHCQSQLYMESAISGFRYLLNVCWEMGGEDLKASSSESLVSRPDSSGRKALRHVIQVYILYVNLSSGSWVRYRNWPKNVVVLLLLKILLVLRWDFFLMDRPNSLIFFCEFNLLNLWCHINN